MNKPKRFHLIPACAVAAGLAFGAAGNVQAEPVVIKAIQMSAAKDADNPRAAVWKRAPRVTIPLVTAPAVHASITGTISVHKVAAQAIRTADKIFFRLSWSDPTRDATLDATTRFLDAVALQFPLDGDTGTSVLMGNTGKRVNVWQWRADNRVQNLFADGFGTLTPAPVQDVSGHGVYSRGGWSVVLSRSLKSRAEDGVQLNDTGRIPIAPAVWNGSNQERDGFKAVTMEWQSLVLKQ